MKEKSLFFKLIAAALLVLAFSEIAAASGKKDASAAAPKSQKLIVGTMANALGLPVKQALEAGYFKKAGLDIELNLFATGAPINEAMAAGKLDLAVSGMASVYALATGNYKYVGDGCITVSGQSMYARADSPIVKSKGPIEGLMGSKEALKGKSVLGPLATTAHYQAIKYMETFGLSTDDFSMVSMDYAQAYQAFVSGKGDLIATISPFNTQLEGAGYVKVCDVSLVMGSPIVDAIYVQNAVIKNRRDDVKKFLECYYQACEDLKKDNARRSEVALKWYTAEGRKYTDKDMATELKQQTYHDFSTLLSDKFKFGLTMTSIGTFFANQNMIEKDKVQNIAASLDSTLLEELKAARK